MALPEDRRPTEGSDWRSGESHASAGLKRPPFDTTLIGARRFV